MSSSAAAAPQDSAPRRPRALATWFASLGFLILTIGISYFAILVLAIQFAESGEERAAHYWELAKYLSGRLEWYLDARIYGAASLLSALVSVLFGLHPLARVTIPVAGICYAVLHLFSETIWEMITSWAKALG